jgi:hypothetical protein
MRHVIQRLVDVCVDPVGLDLVVNEHVDLDFMESDVSWNVNAHLVIHVTTSLVNAAVHQDMLERPVKHLVNKATSAMAASVCVPVAGTVSVTM